MRKKYVEILERFIKRYNDDHTSINLKIQELEDSVILVDNGKIFACGPNYQDLCIMLFLVGDTRYRKNPNYWIENKDRWFYDINFLYELLNFYKKYDD